MNPARVWLAPWTNASNEGRSWHDKRPENIKDFGHTIEPQEYIHVEIMDTLVAGLFDCIERAHKQHAEDVATLDLIQKRQLDEMQARYDTRRELLSAESEALYSKLRSVLLASEVLLGANHQLQREREGAKALYVDRQRQIEVLLPVLRAIRHDADLTKEMASSFDIVIEGLSSPAPMLPPMDIAKLEAVEHPAEQGGSYTEIVGQENAQPVTFPSRRRKHDTK